MFIIVGLGNPESEYKGTRHNAGFEVIDVLAEKYNISVDIRKHRAFIGKGMIGGRSVILAKPQTFMNLSGESVRSLLDFYKADPETELLIIYDDISLDVGQIRIRAYLVFLQNVFKNHFRHATCHNNYNVNNRLIIVQKSFEPVNPVDIDASIP